MADNDFMVCPSQVAGGRTDRCGQYSHPRTCWFDKCSMLDNSKPTPTPSITVGTQVRLTGVVREVQLNGVVGVDIYVGCQGGLHWFKPSEIEVIRQPFKRGEVVWSVGAVNTGEQYVVFNDEFEGRIDVVHCPTGTATTNNDASRFERRP
jgi:hypothetical protein